jgi:predicted small integral membrane protein
MRAERGSLIAAALLLAGGLALGAAWLAGAVGQAVEGLDLTRPLAPGQWMAWTGAGALFFGVIATLLVVMILWGALAPETPRRGALGIETTPGDRLFISLLGAAYVHLAWLALAGAPLWGALALSLVLAAAVFRWV